MPWKFAPSDLTWEEAIALHGSGAKGSVADIAC